jgi:uncharacterized protein (TIGR00369 family)
MRPSQIKPDEFLGLLREGMPSAAAMRFDVVTLEYGRAVLRMPTGAGDLRPGGTVSGPTLFALADLAVYAMVLTTIGPVPLAVTTDATIHFLRKPQAGWLVAHARLLKDGSRLVVGDVTVSPEGPQGPQGAPQEPVVHAVMTYSLPRK